MKNTIKSASKKFLPKKILSQIRTKSFEKKIKVNNLVDLKIQNIIIKCPNNHPLLERSERQPYRNLSLGISVKFFSEKYPGYKIIDIGANIGDTAAMIASFATSNPIILVEPSEVYHRILEENCKILPSIEKLEKLYIIDGTVKRGELFHRGGTASFKEDRKSNNQINAKRLDEIADEKTKFIKIDTDGYDYSIINSSLEYLSHNLPLIYFENEIVNHDFLELSNQTFHNLFSVGYKHFIIWDDRGVHILSTESISDITRFNYYLYKTHSNTKCLPTIYGSNVLCLPESDKYIYDAINSYYENY